MVPTHRPVAFLEAAIALATDLRCPLLVLCNGESRARAVEWGPDVEGTAVTLPPVHRHPLLALRTHGSVPILQGPYLDSANKRNIGLLLGRSLGWENLLFLDDDISALSARHVRRAVAALRSASGLRMVGWRPTDFPDNSVVCHALRSSGGRQDVFIGVGALLVDLTGPIPFFPPVYNEDWLFWHDDVARRQVAHLGRVRQVRYDPYADPQRARREEFGDVLAEGLYELIHQRRSVLVGCLPPYWIDVIRRREQVIGEVEQRLWRRRARHERTRDGHDVGTVLRAMAASREALASVTAQDLAEFTALWRHDLFTWNARLHQVPRHANLTDALAELNLTDVHPAGGVRPGVSR